MGECGRCHFEQRYYTAAECPFCTNDRQNRSGSGSTKKGEGATDKKTDADQGELSDDVAEKKEGGQTGKEKKQEK